METLLSNGTVLALGSDGMLSMAFPAMLILLHGLETRILHVNYLTACNVSFSINGCLERVAVFYGMAI
jgi:hypothetical protein